MLNLDLDNYTKEYSIEEKRVLEDCFKQIQSYLKETIISKNPTHRLLEYELGYLSEVYETYLVIDCNENQVYLKKQYYHNLFDYYFIGDKRESGSDGDKYTVCGAVIGHWPKIKEDLKRIFRESKSLMEICESFSA